MDGTLIKSMGSFRGYFDIDLETSRSVYMPALRGGTPPLLGAFNFPPPSLVIGNRQSTTVPTQALVMMNSPWVIDHADFTAIRLMKMVESDSDRVHHAYRLIFNRHPTSEEVERALKFIEDSRGDSEVGEIASPYAERDAWALLCQSLMASAEFLWVR